MKCANRHFAQCTILVAALIASACLNRPVHACNVPVFRYALEKWDPHFYEAIVFYDGHLPDGTQQALEQLENRPVNLAVVTADVRRDDLHQDLKSIWEREREQATLPWIVLRYPFQFRNNVATNLLWSGAFDEAVLERIVHSPARREVAEHILQGMSAVWVLVEGANASANDQAFKVLQDRLDLINRETTLPDDAIAEVEMGDRAPGSPGYVPLKIDFSIVRLSRDDPEERLFLSMLLKTEPDSEKRKAQPFAFPIFGQGRVLWALIGDGIDTTMIDNACAFMLGPCSCTIKDQNPGVDMLIQADWYGGVRNLASVSSEAPTLVGMTHPETDMEANRSDSDTDVSIGRIVAATLAALLVVVVLIGVKAFRRNDA